MLNKRVILISGFARGGTNLLWNILQSHPAICSTGRETGELFREFRLLSWCKKYSALPFRAALIDAVLYQQKLKTLQDPDNRYKTKQEVYTPQEVKESILCLKSVNQDVFLTDLLLKVYPDLKIIGLTRNGISLLEGYLRRGHSVESFSAIYNTMAGQFQRLEKMVKNFKLVKFEHMMADPFGLAAELFNFGDVPGVPEQLRFKSKRVVTAQGGHEVGYGEENRKYWFDRDQVSAMLQEDVNKDQANRIAPADRLEFSGKAAAALRYFGYTD